MKYLIIYLVSFSLLLGVFLYPAQAETNALRDFKASTVGQEVHLEWYSNAENNITEFRIQRSFDGINFRTIYQIPPKGSYSKYTYIDSDLFKNEIKVVHYRIEVAFRDGHTEWSKVELATLSFSGLRRTWGSIKAMFR